MIQCGLLSVCLSVRRWYIGWPSKPVASDDTWWLTVCPSVRRWYTGWPSKSVGSDDTGWLTVCLSGGGIAVTVSSQTGCSRASVGVL